MIFLALFLLIVGIFFTLVGVLGLYRFPDAYTRVKAMALVNLPGAVCIHVASSMMVPGSGERGYVTALLFILSGPILSYALLYSAHHLHVVGIGRFTAVEDENKDDKEE